MATLTAIIEKASDGGFSVYSPDVPGVSLSGFFEAFPFINASQLGAAIGINPSLMRRYKSGQKGVSQKQRQLIQSEIGKIASRLQSVRF